MRVRLLVTSFCILAFVPFSLQCKKSAGNQNGPPPRPPPPIQNPEERLKREQELKIWCLDNCVTTWTPWSNCDSQCGKGKKERFRQLTRHDSCKQFGCPQSLHQTVDCDSGCIYGGIAYGNLCFGCPSSRQGKCCEEEIICPALSLGNGTIKGNWPAKRGSTAQFTCKVGYNLNGFDEAICLKGSSWSKPTPKCELIQCVQPIQHPNVKILNIKTEGYAFGEQVLYDCEDGYTMLGERTRTCQRGITGEGAWSGHDVLCKPVKCPEPTIPENGDIKIHNTSFQYKDVINYSCDEGYKLIGSNTMQCLASGSWFGREPQCEVISCEPPFTPRHGQVRIRKAGIKAFALFECDEGYRLEPNIPLLICTYAGTWNGTEPNCIASSCGDPGSPVHGYRDGSVLTFGNKVTFHCEKGYEMKGGSQTIECQSNSQWSGRLPICEACQMDFFMEGKNCKKCPANSYTVTNASTSVVQCLCDQEKGFVGPPGGPCEEVFCTVLKAPDNGAISKCGNKVGDYCDFTCNDGFVVERGSTKRTCHNTGDWDGTTAFCVPCKLNTYKSGERTCSPCPLHSHTEAPAQMETGCICDEGYSGAPGGPCLDVNECQENEGKGPCKDTCENNDGGFHCRCSIPGYKISPQDTLSCIAEQQCRNLTRDDAPENGGLICHWYYEQNSQHCTTKCNPGFEMPSRTNDYETCGPATDYEWSYQLVNTTAILPPCFAEFFPEFRLEGETAYFAAACEDLTEVQKTAAKEEFAKRLNDNGVCSKGKTKICNIKDMGIICGRTTRRRRRRGVDILEHSVDFAYKVSALKFEDKTEDCEDKICPMLRIPPRYCNQYCKPMYKRYLKASVEFARRQLLDIHKDKTKMQHLAFKVDSLDFMAQEDGFRASDVTKECPHGMAAIDDQCVPCRAGTYLNEETNECLACPRHTFQDKDQHTFCIPCKTFGPGYSTSRNGSAICQLCLDGTWGENCTNRCNCVHGSCSPFDGECICPSGWEGDRCEIDINSCVEGSCYPGVTCIDEPPPASGFSCGPCPSGYHGDGITCTPKQVQKVCLDGTWGENCTNRCNCVHGSCSPFYGECICPSGWEGDRCEKDINSCVEGSCYPGVTCIDEPPPSSGFSCGPCPSGYHGDGINCTPKQVQKVCLDGTWGENCTNHCNCVHGSCNPFDGECICPSGWEGDSCEKDINSCVEGSCFPGVTCIDEPPPASGFSCGPCPSGYHGDGITCTPKQVQKDCLDGTWGENCTNRCNCVHGSCNPFDGECICPSGWEGDNCEKVCLDGTWGEDCANRCNCVHGSCSPFDGECICPSGWEGSRCEKDINSCVEGSCYPGVTCIDQPPPASGFSCGPCPSGYSGDGISCTSLLSEKGSIELKEFENYDSDSWKF